VTEAAHRAGVVALLGRPNAGKSTLLNALVGEKLAIVTAKPQTTRSRILGIATREGVQALLLDTPGMHEGGRPLNRALNAIVEEVVGECDAALLLVDPRRGWDAAHEALRAKLAARGAPVLVVATHADLAAPAPDLPADLAVSAKTGEGLEELWRRLAELLPESPPLFAADELTDRPLRFLAAELVREAVFEELEQELPYAVAVEIESFDESRPELVAIRATLLVERESQKRIAVGRGGAQIKRIGQRARAALEALLGRQVHLALWVRVEPRWPRSKKRLAELGYR
jgi:GTP-binding protein Era